MVRLYRATTETTGNLPTDTSYWTLYVNGINPKGTWATTTEYLPNDVVVYGGNNYRALVAHAGTTFATDLAANKWEKFNGGIDWKGNWSASGYDYKVDDVVKNNVSSYIALEDHTSGSTFATDLAAGKWELFAEGGDYVLPQQQATRVDSFHRMVQTTFGMIYQYKMILLIISQVPSRLAPLGLRRVSASATIHLLSLAGPLTP